MKSNGPNGVPLWGYRYRTGGRGSRRVQRGGFVSERDAWESLEIQKAGSIGGELRVQPLLKLR